MAKVMGNLAGCQPEDGQKVSGVLVKRGFNYHLIDPSDLASECVCMHVFGCENVGRCIYI